MTTAVGTGTVLYDVFLFSARIQNSEPVAVFRPKTQQQLGNLLDAMRDRGRTLDVIVHELRA